jgi:hypothetical protein
MIRNRIRPCWCVWVLLAMCLGCDGSGGGVTDVTVILEPPIDEPEAGVSIAGQWATTTTEVFDTCGFDPLPSYSPLLIEEAGDSIVFTFQDPTGFCDESARERSGNFVTLTRTNVVEACGGTVLVQSNVVYEFTENGLTGTGEHLYSNMTASCENLPCEYRLSVAGIRCEDCWPGCQQPGLAVGRAPEAVDGLHDRVSPSP